MGVLVLVVSLGNCANVNKPRWPAHLSRYIKKGDLKGIFKSLQEPEMASGGVSFKLDDILSEEEREKVMSVDMDSLRKLCLELMEEAKNSKDLVTTLVHDALEMKKKVRKLEDTLEKQDAVLTTSLPDLMTVRKSWNPRLRDQKNM